MKKCRNERSNLTLVYPTLFGKVFLTIGAKWKYYETEMRNVVIFLYILIGLVSGGCALWAPILLGGAGAITAHGLINKYKVVYGSLRVEAEKQDLANIKKEIRTALLKNYYTIPKEDLNNMLVKGEKGEYLIRFEERPYGYKIELRTEERGYKVLGKGVKRSLSGKVDFEQLRFSEPASIGKIVTETLSKNYKILP